MRVRCVRWMPLCVAAAATYAHSAQAADEYSLLLLDATGSMSVVDIAGGPTRWENAVNSAADWVTQDRANIAPGGTVVPRGYGIWSFKNDLVSGQQGLKQLWPLANGDCPEGTMESLPAAVIGGAANFCTFTKAASYVSLVRKLNDCSVSGCVLDGPAKPLDGMPTTPLAQSLCDSITLLRQAVPAISKTITLESDGNENDTPLTHPCKLDDRDGPITSPDGKLLFSQVDWAMTPDSWENRVMRRAYLNNLDDASIAAGTALVANPPGNLPVNGLPGLRWRVDLHYANCPATGCNSPFPTALFALSPAMTAFLNPTGDVARSPQAFRFLNASPAAASTVPTFPTISSSELGFFRALGTLGSKAAIREIVTVDGMVFGVDHPVPGDVDNSGCVDRADFSFLNAPGVFQTRQVEAGAPGVMADLNRDGWVNFKDRDILVANLGRGCIASNLIPDPLPTGTLDLQVRSADNVNSCVYGSFRPEFKIINRGTTAYPLNGIDVRMAFNNDFEEAIEFVVGDNVVLFNSNGGITGQYGHVIPVETTPANSECVIAADRGATQTHHVFLASNNPGASIPPNGGYATVIVQYRRAGGAYPFDVGCNDFSRVAVDPTRTFKNSKFFNLVRPSRTDPPTELSCEFSSRTVKDSSSGIDPGVVACGMNACN